jgi:aryl-alcohol dehydrogenase-like predicted oxidoreductase
MQTRTLGALSTSALGLGCMGMTFAYSGAETDRSIATLEQAIASGITLFDTADVYGPETNELLVGPVLRRHRDDIVLATKFGARSLEIDGRAPDGRPEYVHRACDASLRRLGMERIDLYYQHRVDPQVPIEETVGAMGELVAAGKVRFLGLSGADRVLTVDPGCRGAGASDPAGPGHRPGRLQPAGPWVPDRADHQPG